jgi:hypothetical protein
MSLERVEQNRFVRCSGALTVEAERRGGGDVATG